MRGPFSALWNTRIIGTYLRVRVAILLAGVLGALGAVLLLGDGGILGLMALFGVVVVVFGVLGWMLLKR
jgi:hypothetical protein